MRRVGMDTDVSVFLQTCNSLMKDCADMTSHGVMGVPGVFFKLVGIVLFQRN